LSIKREVSEENRKFNSNQEGRLGISSPITMANHSVLWGCK